MKQILPAAKNTQTPAPDLEKPTLKAKSRRGTKTDVASASFTDIRPSKQIIYRTPKSEPLREDDDDDDDGVLEKDAKRFGRENVGSVASPYQMPYVCKRRFLDTQYGIRKEGDTFKIGDTPVLVDQDGDITIKENEFRGSEGLWELLTRKNANKEHVTSDDLRKYKKILLLTNAHLEGYDPSGAINFGRGNKFREIIAPFFASPKSRGVESGLRRAWKYTKLTAKYYNPEKPTAFSTLDKLAAAIPRKNKSDVKEWLEYQDVYKMHRPARSRFLRNPYTVTNLMQVWESDILDMQSLSKYNGTYRYIVSLIDAFSKYLHLVPIRKKIGPTGTSAFRSLLHDDSPRPLWVSTDMGYRVSK